MVTTSSAGKVILYSAPWTLVATTPFARSSRLRALRRPLGAPRRRPLSKMSMGVSYIPFLCYIGNPANHVPGLDTIPGDVMVN